MFARASRPWVFSSLLHASVAGLVVWMMWMQRDATPKPVVIFQMPVTASSMNSPASAAMAPTAPNVRFTPVPVVARPQLHPQPPEVSDVVETPVRPAASSRPAVRPQVLAVKSGNRPTTITEHRSQHPRPAVSALPTTVAAVTRINLDEVLASGVATRSQSPAVDAPRADSYFERLLGKLRASHKKPAGLGEGLQVRVEFVLRADGTMGAVRILKTSGSAEFDASVAAAFNRLSDLGVPPAGAAGVHQVTFRTQVD